MDVLQRAAKIDLSVLKVSAAKNVIFPIRMTELDRTNIKTTARSMNLSGGELILTVVRLALQGKSRRKAKAENSDD